MIYLAYKARELTEQVLLRDEELEKAWREAAERNWIRSVNCRDCAYSVILEPSFAEKVRSRATGVVAYGYDPQTRRVAPPGQA